MSDVERVVGLYNSKHGVKFVKGLPENFYGSSQLEQYLKARVLILDNLNSLIGPVEDDDLVETGEEQNGDVPGICRIAVLPEASVGFILRFQPRSKVSREFLALENALVDVVPNEQRRIFTLREMEEMLQNPRCNHRVEAFVYTHEVSSPDVRKLLVLGMVIPRIAVK